MSSKFIIDSMLPKYHQQFHHQNLFAGAGASPLEASLSSQLSSSLSTSLSSSLSGGLGGAALGASSPGAGSPQRSSSSSSASPGAPARMYPYVSHHQQFGGSTPFSGGGLSAADDKSCRYPTAVGGDPMVNYALGQHNNGAAVSAASASMAAAAQFYHQAAASAASAASAATVDAMGVGCAQPSAQPLPDIPRYPWMSITGNDFLYLVIVACVVCIAEVVVSANAKCFSLVVACKNAKKTPAGGHKKGPCFYEREDT